MQQFGIFNIQSRPLWSLGYHTRHWIRGSRVQTRPGWMDFSERKNPEYDLLRKASKALGPVYNVFHYRQFLVLRRIVLILSSGSEVRLKLKRL